MCHLPAGPSLCPRRLNPIAAPPPTAGPSVTPTNYHPSLAVAVAFADPASCCDDAATATTAATALTVTAPFEFHSQERASSRLLYDVKVEVWDGLRERGVAPSSWLCGGT